MQIESNISSMLQTFAMTESVNTGGNGFSGLIDILESPKFIKQDVSADYTDFKMRSEASELVADKSGSGPGNRNVQLASG